jgi:hypothetical protein
VFDVEHRPSGGRGDRFARQRRGSGIPAISRVILAAAAVLAPASRAGNRHTTTVTAHAPVRLRIGHTLPAGADVD